MKTITSSVAYQDELGNPLAKGSLILSLPVGAYLIAGGGQVVGTSVIINLDGTGKIPAGTSIWASDELNPQTPYSATICSGSNGNGPLAYALWFISGASPIDLSQITPLANGQPSFMSPVVLNPTAAQTITGQPLILAASTPLTANGTANLVGGGSLAGTFSGAPTLSGNPSFTGSPTFSLVQINGSTTGISSTVAGRINVGNGTSGDSSGAILANNYQSASANRSATGVVRLASTDSLAWRNNGNSADVTFSKNASDQFVLGSTVVPNSSDTAVLRSSTDVLTNKTIGAGGLSGLTLSKQVFTSSGTFTIPSGITSVKATVTGAGGAGGGATTTANASGTGGGGAGTAIKWLSGLTPGNTLTVTVGTGGTGSANAVGNPGGNSTVASGTQTISTISGNGGGGGAATGNVVGAVGGAGTGGDINLTGSQPMMALVTYCNAGSNGGASFWAGGGGGGFTGSGAAGTSPGSGGGGAGGGASGAVAGGAGANGIVVFEWVN